MNHIAAMDQSPVALDIRARAVPIVSTMLGSLVTTAPIIATAPLMPPFGLMMLLGWRLLRPGFWAPWAGLPLGLFDDLVSGQPLGSAMLSWTIALLAIDASERYLVWRDYWQDWFIAAATIAGCLILGFLLTLASGGGGLILIIVPQIFSSILLFPLVARLCAWFDAWRLR